LRDSRGVGAHVCDETNLALDFPELDAFVEILREPHRALGAEAELLGGLLLKRARLERLRRILAALASLDVGAVEGLPARDVGDDRLRARLVRDERLVAVH